METQHTEFVDLDRNEHAMNALDIDSFRKNGHVLLKNILSREEIGTYRQLINDAVSTFNTERRSLRERDTYGKAFLQVENLWTKDARVERFSLARRFGKIAAALLGSDKVRIYHDQALYKEPGGGFTPWHQDQFYWPLSTSNTVTMWMPLIDISQDMGILNFASGSHRETSAERIAISDESEQAFERLIDKKKYSIWQVPEMSAGDATFHYGWTLHRAPGNKSNIMREVMTIIFFEDGAFLSKPQTDEQASDLRRWFPGKQPGDLAASGLNPIVT